MSEFTDTVHPDTPRLVVLYHKDSKGVEKFEWTVVGGMPTLSVVGAIMHAQIQLLTRDPYMGQCPDSMLVIALDTERMEFHNFVDPVIPQEGLAGYLELVKAGVAASLLQKSPPRLTLLGPDGRPMRG